MKKPSPITALEAELKRLPDRTNGRAHNWTPLQDEMLLKYGPVKGLPAVSAILGLKYETCRRRLSQLKAKSK